MCYDQMEQELAYEGTTASNGEHGQRLYQLPGKLTVAFPCLYGHTFLCPLRRMFSPVCVRHGTQWRIPAPIDHVSSLDMRSCVYQLTSPTGHALRTRADEQAEDLMTR